MTPTLGLEPLFIRDDHFVPAGTTRALQGASTQPSSKNDSPNTHTMSSTFEFGVGPSVVVPPYTVMVGQALPYD